MGVIVRALEWGTDKFNSGMKYLCTALLFGMMLLGTADVMGRYLFNSPVFGTYEIFGVLLPAIVLLGLSYAQAARAHVRITLVFDRLPSGLQRVFSVLTTLIMLLIAALIFWNGLGLALRFIESGKEIDTIRIPIFYPQLIVPLGAAALFFVLLVQLIHMFKKSSERS